MQTTSANGDDEPTNVPIPVLNGIELTDIEALYEALDHLEKKYNNGHIEWADGGQTLQVYHRNGKAQHQEIISRAVAHPESTVWLKAVTVRPSPGRYDLNELPDDYEETVYMEFSDRVPVTGKLIREDD